MLVFIHIHKCGGTSLQSILKRNFKSKKYVNSKCLINTDDALGNSIFNFGCKNGYVIGHICYGAHKLFPFKCQYATMLRNPIDRIISIYRHASYDSKAYYYKSAKNISFIEFLRSKSVLELDNGMVRFLSGDINGNSYFINPKPFGTISEKDLDLALFNLNTKFVSFGLLEYFDQSILLFEKEIELHKKYYIADNETSKKIEKPQFSSEFECLVKYDNILYNEALRCFRERIKKYNITDTDLCSYRRIKKRYAPLLRSERFLKSFAKNAIRSIFKL